MVNRLLAGQRADGSYGIDFSQPAVEVMGAADNGLKFSSKFASCMVIHQAGTVAWGGTASFPTLAYTPLAVGMMYNQGLYYPVVWNQIKAQHSSNPEVTNFTLFDYLDPVIQTTTNSLIFGDSGYHMGSRGGTPPQLRYIVFRVPGYVQ